MSSLSSSGIVNSIVLGHNVMRRCPGKEACGFVDRRLIHSRFPQLGNYYALDVQHAVPAKQTKLPQSPVAEDAIMGHYESVAKP